MADSGVATGGRTASQPLLSTYSLAQGFFIGLGVPLLLYSCHRLRVLYSYWRRDDSDPATAVDLGVCFFGALCYFGIAVRGIDPESKRGVLPYVIEVLASDLSTASCFSILFVLMFSILYALKADSRTSSLQLISWLRSLLFVATWLLFTALSFMQGVYFRFYLVRGMKLALMGVLLAGAGCYTAYLVLASVRSIRRFIIDTEPNVERREARLKATRRIYINAVTAFAIAVLGSIWQALTAIASWQRVGEPPPEIDASSDFSFVEALFPALQWVTATAAFSLVGRRQLWRRKRDRMAELAEHM